MYERTDQSLTSSVLGDGGITVGFRTFILRIPDQSLTVITLFNRADVRAEEIARQLAHAYSFGV